MQQSANPSDLKLNIFLELLFHRLSEKHFHVNPREMKKVSSSVTSVIATARFSEFSQGPRVCADLHDAR